jgi:hypothetical protein
MKKQLNVDIAEKSKRELSTLNQTKKDLDELIA